jgi:hypothetical protein
MTYPVPSLLSIFRFIGTKQRPPVCALIRATRFIYTGQARPFSGPALSPQLQNQFKNTEKLRQNALFIPVFRKEPALKLHDFTAEKGRDNLPHNPRPLLLLARQEWPGKNSLKHPFIYLTGNIIAKFRN